MGEKHGCAPRARITPEYRTWLAMKRRCENPKAHGFVHYGGRGIKVCVRWRQSFEAFLADMGLKPSPKHSIDRYPNNDGNYEPTNCRWATRKQQMATRRTARGDRHGRAKLTEAQARQILQSPITSAGGLADRYGVNKSAVYKIWTRETWRHLGAPKC